MMELIELKAIIPETLADALSDYFFEIESTEWGILQKEITDPYELFGLFEDAERARLAWNELQVLYPAVPAPSSTTVRRQADWKNAYKRFVRVWNDRQLHWIPLWERANYQPPAAAACVYLDAGMAFGTGAHETTRLCARRLLDYAEANADTLHKKQVIDAGCGSGVLALSAAALGFQSIYAFDFDPLALEVCQENRQENAHLKASIDFQTADLATGFADKRQGDCILANIQTDVLIPESEHLIGALNVGASLILSGILSRELDRVRQHYQQHIQQHYPGPITVDSRSDGEWSDLLFIVGH
jgi:ribosomal protein L11 methyltransferase